jgi:phosphatidate cytidylyltransferase
MRTRIIVGTILSALAFGMFYGDHVIGRPYPFLLVVSLLLAVLGGIEFSRMVGNLGRLAVLVPAGAAAVLVSHWAAAEWTIAADHGPVLVAAVTVCIAFVIEMSTVVAFGNSVHRIAVAVLGVVYLGVLSGFLVDLRLFQRDAKWGTTALILAVFVPKSCDIGAYFAGSLFGRHKMTPLLSPKKTWEGAAGGLLTSTLLAVAVEAWSPIIVGGLAGAAVFGVAVGAAGMVGDLAESLIKRDCQTKDASQLIPGFGGILDVIDAILFAAPFVYLWLTVSRPIAAG